MNDPLGRTVDYLRLSVTDRCNERCLYCMPEHYRGWLPQKEILSDAELMAVVRVAAGIGFKRFRVTGGEPLLRPGIVEFMADLAAFPGVESVQMTTNGMFLPRLGDGLVRAGVRNFNISLDALDPARYRAITHGDVAPVIDGIRQMKALGCKVKLNTVLMRGKNEDQIESILDFAGALDVVVRFIELMPVSMSEMLSEENFLPVGEVRRNLEREDILDPIEDALGFGPARYYRLRRRGVIVGFISAITDLHFCERCNKMRLTADGKLRPCLGNHLETDLLPALRPDVDLDALEELFLQTLAGKPAEHLFRSNYQPGRVMTAIGG
ncbi:MAG: GTP 3',8-cyclase MoaA [Terrimicrobiaceae bacterium]|nr:GTP 3',8-cyclase MoaA [Terrimicrobiaceae bacterium]